MFSFNWGVFRAVLAALLISGAIGLWDLRKLLRPIVEKLNAIESLLQSKKDRPIIDIPED
jgi:hypothetical protein